MSWRIFPRREPRERGATTLLLALLMTVLLVCLACAVDLGKLYWVKGQLQTGADAAALAVAQDCRLKGVPICTLTAAATAQDFAAKNHKSGLVGTKLPVFPSPGSVKITTIAKNSGGDGVEMVFAKLFGIPTVQASATAVAAWGSPYSGMVAVPVVISECDFNLSGAIQLVKLDNGLSCTSSGGIGNIIPGGFGWLDSDPYMCGLAVSLANPNRSSSTGLGEPTQCKPVFDSLKNKVILLPIYDGVTGTGTNVIYHIKGFAAFELHGFSFPGHEWNNTGPLSCVGTCKGLIGKFVRYVIADSSWTVGGPDMGASRLRLTQ